MPTATVVTEAFLKHGRLAATNLKLAELPLAYREALLLVAIEGLKPAEAAQVCGVSGEAMRQRLSRGRAMLAERLRRAELPLTLLEEVRS